MVRIQQGLRSDAFEAWRVTPCRWFGVAAMAGQAALAQRRQPGSRH